MSGMNQGMSHEMPQESERCPNSDCNGMPLDAKLGDQWICPKCGLIWELDHFKLDGPFWETVGQVESADSASARPATSEAGTGQVVSARQVAAEFLSPGSCPICNWPLSLTGEGCTVERCSFVTADLVAGKSMADNRERWRKLTALLERYAASRLAAAQQELAKMLHINYCPELVEEGGQWEVGAEPEPQYFGTLNEAIELLVNLPDPQIAALQKERDAAYNEGLEAAAREIEIPNVGSDNPYQVHRLFAAKCIRSLKSQPRQTQKEPHE